jgi:hypothetical protein
VGGDTLLRILLLSEEKDDIGLPLPADGMVITGKLSTDGAIPSSPGTSIRKRNRVNATFHTNASFDKV